MFTYQSWAEDLQEVWAVQIWIYKWVNGLTEIFSGSFIDEGTGESMEYQGLIKRISTDKYGIPRLNMSSEDWHMAYVTWKESDIPKDRQKDVTYGRIVVSYRTKKLDPNRSRLTLGGERIVCLYDVSTPASDLPTIKMHWDSVLSSPGAKFFTVNIANFYLGTPMDRPEFMRLPIKIIPQEIIDN